MTDFEMTVPCIFGLESFVTRELKQLGINTTSVTDGHINFRGGYEELIKANIWLRTGERVLIKITEFVADNFDDFYQGIKNAPWKDFLPSDAKIPITGHCINSKLSSVQKCRSIIKRAVADSMNIAFLQEDGGEYQIRFTILKDKVSVYVDSSGDGLHKRGYRRLSNAAPLKETIAAAMVSLSRWRYEDPLLDPFCGSGTIAIEAAMYKLNIAPGLKRSFAFENFDAIDKNLVKRVRLEAESAVKDIELNITASDIDPECVKLTRENAQLAGVGEYIKVFTKDARNFKTDVPGGTIITNPPYGERLSDIAECKKLYKEIGVTFSALDNWAYFILASADDFQSCFNKQADKMRKVYNGTIKCNIYQYFKERKNF